MYVLLDCADSEVPESVAVCCRRGKCVEGRRIYFSIACFAAMN